MLEEDTNICKAGLKCVKDNSRSNIFFFYSKGFFTFIGAIPHCTFFNDLFKDDLSLCHFSTNQPQIQSDPQPIIASYYLFNTNV